MRITPKPLLLIIISALLIFITGCEERTSKPLRISANPWIGFTPLVYAQQKGWLSKSRIKLLWVVGLEENAKLFRQGLSDGFAATQYEYYTLENKADVKPYFLFDRSHGADVVLANRSIDALKESEAIDAYLEITSLNKDLLDAFVHQYGLTSSRILLHAKNPESLAQMRPSDTPSILIAYEPYATVIERNGFRRVSSTREMTGTMVIDALWLSTGAAQKYAKELKLLKESVDKAIASLKSDPKEFYETVKGYMENQSFDEFMESLEGIQWVNTNPPKPLLDYMQSHEIATDSLLP